MKHNWNLLMARCAVDFDNTIIKWGNFPPEVIGPEPHVKKYLQEIKDMGFYISIHTCRTSCEFHKHLIDRQEEVRKIEEYMKKYELPYDEILVVDKPIAQFYIDDSAIRYNGSWEDVVAEMKERM